MELEVRKTRSRKSSIFTHRGTYFALPEYSARFYSITALIPLSCDFPLKCNLPEGRGWVFHSCTSGLSRCLNIYLTNKGGVDIFFPISPLYSFPSVKSSSTFANIHGFFHVQWPSPTVFPRSSSRLAHNFNLKSTALLPSIYWVQVCSIRLNVFNVPHHFLQEKNAMPLLLCPKMQVRHSFSNHLPKSPISAYERPHFITISFSN